MLKLIAISDLHGNLPIINVKADIMIIAGDISPLSIQRVKESMEEWIYDSFIPWINSLQVDTVILVAGNHDYYLQNISTKRLLDIIDKTNDKLVYLKNSICSYINDIGEIYDIFGTPYCHIFGNWPFMLSEEMLVRKFEAIPDKIDIIVSHDPPYGIGYHDCSLQRSYGIQEEHLGNIPLRNRLEEIDFGLVLSGHIHSGAKNITEFGNGKVTNVSILDERYSLVYPALVLTLERDDSIRIINTEYCNIEGTWESVI